MTRGTKTIKGLRAAFNFGKNHEGKHSLFLYDVDTVEQCDGFTVEDLNTFIDALTEQRDRLELIEESEHQTMLFKTGFGMPTVKDEDNGEKN
mgnify:FL=1|jgi:hypothetical protein|tara:strand:- start:124 stop:399 length:276 start_codon:yes stop_codon:yes gene_type:complete